MYENSHRKDIMKHVKPLLFAATVALTFLFVGCAAPQASTMRTVPAPSITIQAQPSRVMAAAKSELETMGVAKGELKQVDDYRLSVTNGSGGSSLYTMTPQGNATVVTVKWFVNGSMGPMEAPWNAKFKEAYLKMGILDRIKAAAEGAHL